MSMPFGELINYLWILSKTKTHVKTKSQVSKVNIDVQERTRATAEQIAPFCFSW